jgi:transcriptional regulator with XRE-family HTH domain
MMATMATDLERVAEYVRARRGELGLTQQQLADRAGVDTGTVSALERGVTWPWARNRAAIARALGWPSGSLAAIGSGGEPGIVTAEPASAAPAPLPAGVAPDPVLQELWRDLQDPKYAALNDELKRALIVWAATMRSLESQDQRKTG